MVFKDKLYYFFMNFVFILSLFSSINENLLRNELFENRNYFSDSLPKDQINLTLGIAIRSFNSINQVDGTLNTNIWLRYYWNDENLKWNPNNFNNITSISVNTDPEFDHSIWIPDIYLYNTAELPMQNLDYSRAVLYNNGDLIWSRPGMIVSSCVFDLEYFPYDIQKCFLKFGSWSYSKNQINLSLKENPVDFTNYEISDGWELKEYYSELNEVKYECCPEIYPDVKFYFVIKRKPGYYNLNIVIPTYATASLMIVSLLVPWDSGERISFAITVMLSLIVFLLILSENLPKTDAEPLLSRMLIGLTFFSLFVVLFTVFISALYSYKTNKKNVLFRCINFLRRQKNNIKRLSKKSINLNESENDNTIDNDNVFNYDNNLTRTSSYIKANNLKQEINVNITSPSVLSLDEEADNLRKNKINELEKIDELDEKESNNSSNFSKNEYNYRKTAGQLEYIFTFIFFVSFITYSCYMFLLIPD